MQLLSFDWTAILVGSVLTEALVEIISSVMPNTVPAVYKKILAAICGIAYAVSFGVSFITVSEGGMFRYMLGAVMAGLFMSRSSDWIHAVINSLVKIKDLVYNKVQEQQNALDK